MARLFITQREIDFIHDTAKEIIKDVIGQKIYYFPVSEIKSNVYDVYEETPEKVFENPIEIEALVKYAPQEIRSNQFGSEEFYTIEAYLQSRDLIDKEIEVREGDFFSYGETFFEVIQAPDSDTIYGQIEYKSFVTLTGRQARKGQFISKIFGPTDEKYTDADAVQKTFVQQRGFKENKLGETGDKRALVERGVLEKGLTGPAEVSPDGNSSTAISSFYDDK